MCATQARNMYSVATCFMTIRYRNVGVARHIDNYRLTRARRMVECKFGIVCNKWILFHCAIDVCPNFSDVIVKTFCNVHIFVRQRDGFQFQDTLYEWPLESIKGVGNRGNVAGTDLGWRVQGTEISLRWVAWQWVVYRGRSIEEGSGDGHLCPEGPCLVA